MMRPPRHVTPTRSSSTHARMTSSLDELAPGQRFAGLELRQRLGAGGAGTVFRAFDPVAQAEVALKILHPEACAHETSRVRFLREFRAIAKLKHPGCLSVLEEGRVGDLYYYTMELIQGGDLDAYRGSPMPVIIELLHQIASALAHIHSHRIVHRDLKPANILVEQRGGQPHIKLADFGIAKLMDLDHSMTRTGMIIGTVGYMAPEQIRGEEVDPRTDLYALGCIAHELCAGQPPFVHPKGIFEVLRGHLEVPAPSLRSRSPEAPEALDELVDRLLAKEPAARPQSALAVVDALSALRGQAPLEAQPTQERAPSFVFRPAMVGRARERAALLEAIERMHSQGSSAASKPPVAALLCAPAGMGKSRLIDALIKDLQVRHTRVISASVESDPDALFAPFGKIEALVAQALLHAPSAQDGADWGAETLQPGVSPQDLRAQRLHEALAASGQALALAPTDAYSPAALDPDRARRQRAQALVERLRELSLAQPVVLILEDLHQMKPGAMAYLKDMLLALMEPAARRFALVLTARPGQHRQQVAQMVPEDALTSVDLHPLSPDEIEALLGQMLGQAQDVSLLERLVSQVLAQTEGNPLFVQAYLQNIVEQRALKRTREGWTFEITKDTDSILPRSMAQVLTERLSMLDERTFAVLRAASAVGRVFDYALLRPLVEVSEGELLDALDEALRNWIIRSIPGPKHLDVYTFDHARFVDVLYEDMSPSRRRSLHERIGQVLEQRPDTSAQILAGHFARGEDATKARRYLTLAGQEALQAHDHALALTHFSAALELLDETIDEPRDVLLEAIADAHAALGQHEQAIATHQELAGCAPHELTTRARHQRKRARSLYLSGQTQEGILTFERALEDLGEPPWRARRRVTILAHTVLLFSFAWAFGALPRTPARSRAKALERALIHRDLTVLGYWVNLERSSLHQLIYMRLASRLDDPALLVDAYASHLIIASMTRRSRRFLSVLARAQALGSSIGDTLGLARLALFSAVAASFRAERARFTTQLERALSLSEQAADRFNLGFVLMSGGWSATLVGDLARSRALFERAVALGDALGSARVRADGLTGLGALMAMSDEPMEHIAQEVLQTGDALGVPAHQALGHELQGAHHFFRQEFERSAQCFERARTIYEQHRLFGTWGYMVGFEYAEALLCQVDARDGQITAQELQALRRNMRISYIALKSLPPFRGIYESMRGAFEARRGRAKKARALFARARAMRSDDPDHFLTGWMLQRIALELGRLGAKPAELEPLLDQYDQIFAAHPALGLRRWGERARQQLGIPAAARPERIP